MIHLIVSDIDGCLTYGGSHPFELQWFRFLQEWNERARGEEHVPPLTLCTGRPEPYVEAMIQATGCWMPVLCESGGVLYDLRTREMLVNPAFTPDLRERYREVMTRVERHFLSDGRPLYLEPGKTTEITLIPHPPLDVDSLWEEFSDFRADHAPDFILSRTRSVLNFFLPSVNKGSGLRWLSERTDIGLEHIAGFGDSPPDLEFLELVGMSGCPANAMPDVRERCNVVTGGEYHDGAREFLEIVLARNSDSIGS